MYESPNSKVAEVVVPIGSIQFIKTSFSVRFSFDAITFSSNSYLMTAADEHEMRDWMRALTSVMYGSELPDSEDEFKKRFDNRLNLASLPLNSRLDDDTHERKSKGLMGIFNKMKL